MFEALKKTIGVCLIGIGLGILLVLLLPITGWLFIIGCALFILGVAWLFCKKKQNSSLGWKNNYNFGFVKLHLQRHTQCMLHCLLNSAKI